MLWKCSVCGMVVESEGTMGNCPKCGALGEQFNQLSKEEADKIYNAERTNDIHSRIIALCSEILQLSEEGIKINLDPGCFSTFDKSLNEAWIIKQRCKAEIETHIKKEKW